MWKCQLKYIKIPKIQAGSELCFNFLWLEFFGKGKSKGIIGNSLKKKLYGNFNLIRFNKYAL